MLKLSILIRKQGDKLETLYAGTDCGKAINEYKQAKGECYLFEKVRHSRCKDTKFEAEPNITPQTLKRKAV